MGLPVLAFAGSLRAGSYCKMLLALAAERARERGADVDVLDLRDVTMPLYDADLEAAAGLPPGAVELRRRAAAARAVIVVTPEYLGTLPGVLKNALDWASRPPNAPWRGKIALGLGASVGNYGGARALPDLRGVLSALGMLVIPPQLALIRAGEAFDEQGRLRSEAIAQDLDRAVGALIETASRFSGA